MFNTHMLLCNIVLCNSKSGFQCFPIIITLPSLFLLLL